MTQIALKQYEAFLKIKKPRKKSAAALSEATSEKAVDVYWWTEKTGGRGPSDDICWEEGKSWRGEGY